MKREKKNHFWNVLIAKPVHIFTYTRVDEHGEP